MNTTTKLMTLLLALLLPITAIALPPYSYTNYEFEVDGIYYIIENGNACVTFQSWTSGIHVTNYHGDVIIPATVTYQDMTYPVTIIDSYAFYYCEGLTSITIPASITEIRGSAFLGCTGLTRVNITDVEAWCKIKMGDNPIRYARHLYLNDAEVTELTIPDGITSIGQNAFQGWAGLTSVKIPETVTSIGNNAFEDCTGLKSISIPNSVTEIGEIAFEDCINLTNVTLGNSVTTIKLSAFSGCTALESINFPSSVSSIGDGAFNHCRALTGITFGNSVTSIGSAVFNDCTSLTSIVIPNSVTEIGNKAFCGCTSLMNVFIGNSVTTIGKDAFQNNPAIEKVVCKAITPPSWNDMSMFTANVYNHAELHVPIDTEMAYKTSQSWGQFVNIIGDVTIETPGDEDDYEYIPFVREGVKWVYRCENPFLAQILDMPEGLHYYSFEMTGDVLIGDKYYKPVRLTHYLDKEKEVEDFIPVYLREEDKVVYAILPDGILHPQCPVGIGSYIGEPDQELPLTTTDEEFVLYDFNDPNALYQSIHTPDIDNLEYIGNELMSIGNHQVKVHRFHSWYNEDELVIEGIGYDGWAGMPLFYFETFISGLQVGYGLSHVIENGEIIYKGRWYDPNVEPVIPGDANGDGEITIADANSVIDIVIMGGNASHPRMPAIDMNDDGEVTIADVNVIIDIILNDNLIY